MRLLDKACDHSRLASLRRDLSADLGRYPARRGTLSRLGLCSTPQLQITIIHRISHWLWARGHRRAAQLSAWVNLYLHKIAISAPSCIGGGLYLASTTGVVFHGRAGRGLSLYTRSVCSAAGVGLATAEIADAPRLGSGVSIGSQGVVQGGVSLGDNVRVGFGVFVAQDVPDDRTVGSRNMLVVGEALPGAPRVG